MIVLRNLYKNKSYTLRSLPKFQQHVLDTVLLAHRGNKIAGDDWDILTDHPDQKVQKLTAIHGSNMNILKLLLDPVREVAITAKKVSIKRCIQSTSYPIFVP